MIAVLVPQETQDVEITLKPKEAHLLCVLFAALGREEIKNVTGALTNTQINELSDKVIYPIYDFLDHEGYGEEK